MGKIIIIASGKGGTGKTTLCSHIGARLAADGHLTVLVDADAGFRNLDIAIGMESDIVYDYSDFMNGSSELDDITIRSRETENLYFIPAPQSGMTTDFAEDRTEEFWKSLKNRFDYVLADAPAGMGDGFMFAAKYADEAIIAALAETSSLRDADRVIAELEEQGVETIRLVINRLKPELVRDKLMMNIDDCIDVLSIPILGIVPEDDAVAVSMLSGRPLMQQDGVGGAVAFANIAGRITGQYIPMMEFEEKKEGLLNRIKQIIKIHKNRDKGG